MWPGLYCNHSLNIQGEGKKKERRKHIETLSYPILLKTEKENGNNVMGGTEKKAWIYVLYIKTHKTVSAMLSEDSAN